MRIEVNPSRRRLYENLTEATGEAAKSKALDSAARFYLSMRGNTTAVPNGALSELLREAEQQGSLTGEQIAEILTTDELPISYETTVNRQIGSK